MSEAKKYRPSNGTEGYGFIDHWCMNCIHEKFSHTQNHDDKKCDILSESLINGYVDQWIYGEDGSPCCTEFKKFDWGFDDDNPNGNEPPEPPTDDPNQLCFPFIFDEIGVPKPELQTL